MRAGRLRKRARLLDAAGADLGAVLVGLSVDEPSVVSPGLVQSWRCTVRARWSSRWLSGLLLALDDQLLLLGAAVDPDGKRQDLLISARALVGQPAVMQMDGAVVRCALLPYVADDDAGHGYLPAGHRVAAEFCTAERAVVVGDQFVVAGVGYRVLQIDPKHSDGAVLRCWCEVQS